MKTWRQQVADLEPSAAPEIPFEVLKELPPRGIYLRTSAFAAPSDRIVRVVGSGTKCVYYRLWRGNDGWQDDGIFDQYDPCLSYPRLPGIVFGQTVEAMSMAGDQPSGRLKSVTRRRNIPPGIKVGGLFQAWDRSHRQGRGKARGLGVFLVTEIGWSPLSEISANEMRLEGLPDMEPDEFRGLLRKIGAATKTRNAWGQCEEGCWRIGFKAVP